jgi:hypothetical protein
MNPENQRVAIAEACGWTVTHWKVNPFDVIATKDGTEYLLKHLPNYLNDLNAMHDAEEVLIELQKERFVHWLNRLHPSADIHYSEIEITIRLEVFSLVHATASQRAEAFLRTIGKWKEAK